MDRSRPRLRFCLYFIILNASNTSYRYCLWITCFNFRSRGLLEAGPSWNANLLQCAVIALILLNGQSGVWEYEYSSIRGFLQPDFDIFPVAVKFLPVFLEDL